MKADFKDSHPKPPGGRHGSQRELKRPNSKRGATAHKAGHAGWPWLLAGILIGLFVAFVWYLNQHAPLLPPAPPPAQAPAPASETRATVPARPIATEAPKASTIVPRAEPSQPAPARPAETVAKPAEAAAKVEAAKSVAEEPQTPDWSFYQLLEEQTVEVPVDNIRAPRAAKAPDPKQRMLLQVGSFRNLADADRMKAQLALMGFEADIVVTESDQHGTWHRVRLGPYDDARKLAKDRAQLYTRNIESLPMKITQ
ncbi:MAG: SPOR domain-containing protein [Chromatiales bacterium]|nr:SPOR domain-containing protein [Gammaproteobacteria bacterium]MCP5352219.1 SPOR domain-containing protein [Chromatiales bacterium]